MSRRCFALCLSLLSPLLFSCSEKALPKDHAIHYFCAPADTVHKSKGRSKGAAEDDERARTVKSIKRDKENFKVVIFDEFPKDEKGSGIEMTSEYLVTPTQVLNMSSEFKFTSDQRVPFMNDKHFFADPSLVLVMPGRDGRASWSLRRDKTDSSYKSRFGTVEASDGTMQNSLIIESVWDDKGVTRRSREVYLRGEGLVRSERLDQEGRVIPGSASQWVR